jgi:hypothetical protein
MCVVKSVHHATNTGIALAHNSFIQSMCRMNAFYTGTVIKEIRRVASLRNPPHPCLPPTEVVGAGQHSPQPEEEVSDVGRVGTRVGAVGAAGAAGAAGAMWAMREKAQSFPSMDGWSGTDREVRDVCLAPLFQSCIHLLAARWGGGGGWGRWGGWGWGYLL